MTLSELQTRRDTILTRLTDLVKRVSEGDRTVEYSLEQAKEALRIIDGEILAAGGTARPRTQLVQYSNG